ncbi:hypothetical protein [Enterobacter hormaechei]|uniref:hypothetical protein n=1 Tax=Enterobacter hormaechei TaxID=158836 RepID=UPI00287696ED|nr:hypothetical protein [Enterobacter hormaechei]MDR9909382.1 hypothetical protein [Enterobacter hormaechei subsp. steigerwaltii]
MKTTNEQLIEHARENVKALRMAAVQTAFKAARPAIEKDLKLAEIALATLTGTPMFYVDGEAAKRVIKGRTRFATITTEPKKGASLPLYLSPPAPVVPILLPRINHPAQFDYAGQVAKVLKDNGLKVVGHDE